jgi:hypothetical protein
LTQNSYLNHSDEIIKSNLAGSGSLKWDFLGALCLFVLNQCKERITISCTVFVVWLISIEANWNVIFSGQNHLTTAVTDCCI